MSKKISISPIPKAIGICSECKNHSAFKRVDDGIGSYEYWGARGVHHDYHWYSECCEVEPEGELDITEPEIPDRLGEY